MDYRLLHLPYLPVDEEAVPEALIEVPLPSWHTVEKAEFEEIADAEVGEGAEVGRETVVGALVRVHLVRHSHLRLALGIKARAIHARQTGKTGQTCFPRTLHAPLDVQLLVLGEDDNGKVSHRSMRAL